MILILFLIFLFNFAHLASSCECGLERVRPRIFNGERMNFQKYPWMAYIRFYSPNLKSFTPCGGVLIDEYHIMTAAHCLHSTENGQMIKRDPGLTMIYVDAFKTNDKNLPEPFTAEGFLIPPGYKYTQHGNDIALIRLSRPAKGVMPICIPDSDDEPYFGSDFTIAGWGLDGKTNNVRAIPRETVVNHVPYQECYELKKKYYVSKNYISKANVDRVPPLADGEICAINKKTRADACYGDSGNPLMWKDPMNNRWYLIGITAGALDKCGSTGGDLIPGIYTSLHRHKRPLLRKVLRKCVVPFALKDIVNFKK